MYPICNMVRLLCRDFLPIYPYYKTISIGDRLGECVVGYASPNPCILAPSSIITTEQYVEHNIKELEKNILVKLYFTSGSTEIYIYPRRVWEEILRRFIEPLSVGNPPREGGAILYGPPGTGKTSMAKILTWMYGLYRVDVDPQNVLSKWVGESEKNIKRLFSEAEQHEPSLVLFDDAEWLVRSRHLVSVGEDAGVYLSLMNILLRQIESWSRDNRMIVSIITTNVSEEKIDQALRRSGRLGKPIFVPLPDFEAVYTFLLEHGVEPRVAEEYAVKIVNAGLPMSDAKSIVSDLLAGKKPNIEPIKGRGYIRLVPPSLPEHVVSYLKRRYSDICLFMRRGTRLWVPTVSTVSVPLMSSLIGVVCRKPVVVLSDQRFFDEAVTTANTSDATLIVSHDYIQPDYVSMIHVMASSPVVYCGAQRPNVHALPVPVVFDGLVEKRALAELIFRFYGIEFTEEELRDIVNMKDTTFKKIIESIGVVHGPVGTVRRRVAPIA